MRKLVFLAFSTVISFPILVAIDTTVANTTHPPSQIGEFYRNYNFVSLFSSEIERDLVTDSLICKGVLGKRDHINTSFNFCNEVPQTLESERLKRISALIIKLNEHIIRDTRDNMVIPMYVPGTSFHMRRSNPKVMPLFPNPYSVLPRLFEINRVNVSDNSATVEVIVYEVDSETNAKLISQYKRSGSSEEKNHNNEQLLRQAMPSTILSREYHQWILDNGRWQRSETSAALIRK